MANDITFEAPTTTNRYISMYLYVIESSYSVENNTSDVEWEVGIRKGGGATLGTSGNFTWTVNINGAGDVSGSLYTSVPASGQAKFYSGQLTVPHNDDGTKTITCDAVIGGHETAQLGVRTFTLTTIPRASTLSFGTGTIGSPMSVTINSHSTAFRHNLVFFIGTDDYTVATNVAGGTIRWTPPAEIANQVPNATYGVGSFRLETLSNATSSTVIGTTTYTCTLSVPSTYTLTGNSGWAAVAPQGPNLSGYSGYLQSFSKLKVHFDPSKISKANAHGATLAEVYMTYNGTKYSGGTTGGDVVGPTLSKAGSNQVVCSMRDSRGRVQNKTLTFTVDAYTAPKLTNAQLYRSNEAGEADTSGNYLSAQATASVTNLNGANQGSMTLSYGESTAYGTNHSMSSNQKETVGGTLLATKRYYARIQLVDSLGKSAVYTAEIPTEDVTMTFLNGGKGAAFGKYAEQENLLDVDWNLTVHGGEIRVEKRDGSVYLKSTDDNTNPIYHRLHSNQGTLYLHEYSGDTPSQSILQATSAGVTVMKKLTAEEGAVVYGGLNTAGLSVYGTEVVDFILAQGKEGSWRYWKWNSGFAVCIHDAKIAASDDSGNFNANQGIAGWGGMYDLPEYDFDEYPFPFAEVPAVYASRTGADSTEFNSKFVWIAMTGGSTTAPPRFDIVRPDYKTIGHPALSIVAIGRWK